MRKTRFAQDRKQPSRSQGCWMVAVLLLSLGPLFPPEGSAGAQERGKTLVMGLREAAELAVQKVEGTAPQIARWRLKEEQGKYWPELSLRGHYYYQTSTLVVQTPQVLYGPGLEYQEYGAGVQLRYNLFQFLESEPRIKAAEVEERVSFWRLSQEKSEKIFAASEIYLALLWRQENLKALNTLREEQDRFRRQQEAKSAENAIPRIQAVRAESQLISLDREILAARNQAAQGELELRRITGLDPEQPISLLFDPGELDLRFIQDLGLKGILSAAKEGNPRVRSAYASAEGARFQALAARTAWYPSFSLLSSYGPVHADVSNGITDRSTDFRLTAFLVLSFPLFDGGVKKARKAQADLQAGSLRRQADREAEEVRSRIEGDYWSFVEKEEDQKLLRRQIELTEAELKQIHLRVEGGAAPYEEEMAVRTKLLRLHQESAQLRSELCLRGIRLALTAGQNPFTFSFDSSRRRVRVPPAPEPSTLPPPPSDASREGSLIAKLSFPLSPEGRAAAEKPASSADLPQEPGTKEPRARSQGTSLPEREDRVSGPEAGGAPLPAPKPARRAKILTEIRVTKYETGTRISILCDGKVDLFRSFSLRRPSRFALDLGGIQAGGSLPRNRQVGTPPVTGWRIGRHGDKTRIVFDLTGEPARNPEITKTGRGLQIIFGQDR